MLSGSIAPEMSDMIDVLVAGGRLDWWYLAIQESCRHNARSWAYMRRILDSALQRGLPPGSDPPGKNAGRNGEPARARPAARKIDQALGLGELA